jgi:HEAT repeat protein
MLASPRWEAGLLELLSCPKRALHGLIASLYSTDPSIRWHAVTGLGLIVSRIAGESLEEARIVMRRLMWSVNEESGGIGWGAPEAMSEIMARHPGLAREFAPVLRSYIHESESGEDNYLELAPLRRGAIWGIGRLAEADPMLAAPAAEDLRRCLQDHDGPIRGLACLALGLIGHSPARPEIAALTNDPAALDLYLDKTLGPATVAELARGALARLDDSGGP